MASTPLPTAARSAALCGKCAVFALPPSYLYLHRKVGPRLGVGLGEGKVA